MYKSRSNALNNATGFMLVCYWYAAILHKKATNRLWGFVKWNYSNPECFFFIGDIIRNDNSIASVATGWPLCRKTLVSLSLQLHEWQRSLQTRKAAENRAVAVCICFNQNKSKPAAGDSPVALLLHPPPSQKSRIWDEITSMRAATAPM